VTANGRTCSDAATTGLSPTDFQNLLTKGSLRVGSISLIKTTTQTPAIVVGGITAVPASTTTSDFASAGFSQYTVNPLATSGSAVFQQTSFGSCSTYQIQGTAGSVPVVTLPTYLDAGTVTARLPNGSSLPLPKDKSGTYFAVGSDVQGSNSPVFIPSSGGLISFTNSGGADVGQISGAQITMPPALNWTNIASVNTITRSQGQLLTWDTANPSSGYVTITGTSFNIAQGSTVGVVTGFTCTAPYSAGNFTVPSYVLLALVPGTSSVGGISIPTGSLSLSLSAPPVKFDAPSIDYAILTATSGTGKSVTYQ